MDVFLSYARKDLAFVDRLVPDLESRGHVVWRDVSDLAGGDTWRAGISEAIRRSDVVIVVVSPDSARSRNVAKELSVAEEGWTDSAEGRAASYGNCEGWTGMLCAMKVWLEHGINLRDGFYK